MERDGTALKWEYNAKLELVVPCEVEVVRCCDFDGWHVKYLLQPHRILSVVFFIFFNFYLRVCFSGWFFSKKSFALFAMLADSRGDFLLPSLLWEDRGLWEMAERIGTVVNSTEKGHDIDEADDLF